MNDQYEKWYLYLSKLKLKDNWKDEIMLMQTNYKKEILSKYSEFELYKYRRDTEALLNHNNTVLESLNLFISLHRINEDWFLHDQGVNLYGQLEKFCDYLISLIQLIDEEIDARREEEYNN